MSDQGEASVRLILLNQHPSGSYVACPLYFHYAYGWLRDGTFTAYAMDLAGEHASARRFYDWGHRVILRQKGQIFSLIERRQRGEAIAQDAFLNTRYHLNGQPDDAPWGHFQLDGYGAWLWGIAQHLALSGDRSALGEWKESMEATVDYLRALWRDPNFDCWEENGDQVHPATLACLYGGFLAASELLGRPDLRSLAEEVKRFVEENAVRDGHFVKSLRPDGSPAQTGVDASLLWLQQPFGMFEAGDSAMAQTVERIRSELANGGGGVRRYADDSYYGGGEWILLTAWLGWVDARNGNRASAEAALRWIEKQADELGRLPEQVEGPHTDRAAYRDWVERLGTPALPLLWSHAMLLVLRHALQNA